MCTVEDGSAWSRWDLVSVAQGVLMQQLGHSSLEALAFLVQLAVGTDVEVHAAAESVIRSAGIQVS